MDPIIGTWYQSSQILKREGPNGNRVYKSEIAFTFNADGTAQVKGVKGISRLVKSKGAWQKVGNGYLAGFTGLETIIYKISFPNKLDNDEILVESPGIYIFCNRK